MFSQNATPTVPESSSTSMARPTRASRCQSARNPSEANPANDSVSSVRGTDGVGYGCTPNAICQSAHSNTFANCSHSGAMRGKRPATWYCSRRSTDTSAFSESGCPDASSGPAAYSSGSTATAESPSRPSAPQPVTSTTRTRGPAQAKTSAAGSATNTLKCSGIAIAAMNTTSARARRRCWSDTPGRPAYSPAASISAETSSDTAYTSVSVALLQTVVIVPAITAPTTAPREPIHRCSINAPTPPTNALASTDSMVTARAGPVLANTFDTTCAMRTQRGVPGGCGMPNVRAAVASSAASQKVRSGAAVAR